MLMNSIVTLDDLAQVVHYPTHDMQALNRRPKRVVLVNILHTKGCTDTSKPMICQMSLNKNLGSLYRHTFATIVGQLHKRLVCIRNCLYQEHSCVSQLDTSMWIHLLHDRLQEALQPAPCTPKFNGHTIIHIIPMQSFVSLSQKSCRKAKRALWADTISSEDVTGGGLCKCFATQHWPQHSYTWLHPQTCCQKKETMMVIQSLRCRVNSWQQHTETLQG